MARAGVYFPFTTPSQRRLLFETWEATGDVARACRTAHVGPCAGIIPSIQGEDPS